MNLNCIEYLESKNFEVEEIARFQKFLSNTNVTDEEFIKKMEAIYKIFGFAGVPNLTINKLILNNILMLFKSDYELISVAYTWYGTGLIDEAAKRNSIGAENYVRTYLRNVYLNSELNKRKSPISYNLLIKGDGEFSNGYRGKIGDVVFSPNFENLVNLYGKGSTYQEKHDYIKSIINSSALKWYMECIKKVKAKDDESRSI